MVCRIILGRTLSSEGLGMYMMVLPTLSLCITIAQMGIPGAVFKLSADPKYNPKKVLVTGLLMAWLNALVMVILLVGFSAPLAKHLLKNVHLVLALEAVALFIPMASTNNTLRSFFLGQEKLAAPAFSQIMEELIRIIVMLLSFKFLPHLSLDMQVCFAFLAMVAGEMASTLFMLLFSKQKPRQIKKELSEIKKLVLYKDIFSISLPVTASQLMHSLGNFIEPLILNGQMLALGYSTSQINAQFGIVSGYVLSLLMIPTFITSVIYRLILPKLTKSIATHQIAQTKKQLFTALIVCLGLGTPFSILFYFFPEACLNLFYDTTSGAAILRYLAWPFLIYYLQTPLSACLHALSKNKLQFVICTIECLTSLAILYLTIPTFQVTAVAISMLGGLIVNTCLSFATVFYFLFLQKV